MCHGEIQRGLIVRWLVPKQNAFVIIASNSMIIHKLQRKRCFVRPVIVVVSNFTIYLLTDHLCKHSFKDHDPITKKCKKGKCTGCINSKFGSTWSCSCGLKFGEHVTVVETYQERKASGRLLSDMTRIADELDQPLA
jgi:hypothetical protein